MNFKKHATALMLTLTVANSAFGVNANQLEVEMRTEPVVTTTINEEGETVYRQTSEFVVEPIWSIGEKSAYGDSSLGLYLTAGQTATSSPVNFNFSLPSNATVRSVEINPGTGVMNGGSSSSMIGAILITEVNITSPDNKVVTVPWKANGTTDNSGFKGDTANGKWSITVKGTNIASNSYGIEEEQEQEDVTVDPRFFPFPSTDSSLIYSRVQMVIEYTLD